MLNFLSCLAHTKKTIYRPLALLCALLCFIINGISWKRKQKRTTEFWDIPVFRFAKTAELKHRRRNFTGLASISSEYIHKLQQPFYFFFLISVTFQPAFVTILLEVEANHVKRPSSAFAFSGYFQDERDYKSFPHDVTAVILVSQTVLWELNLFLT